MGVFRYREDIFPVTIISGYFLLDLLIYVTVDNPVFLAVWFALGIFPKTKVCVWNHNHHHAGH